MTSRQLYSTDRSADRCELIYDADRGCLLNALPLVAVSLSMAAKVRHDVAREKLIRVPQLFRARPLMCGQHKPAEAAGFRLHAFDLRDRVVRRADNPVAPVGAGTRRDFLRRLSSVRLIRSFQTDGEKILHVAPDILFDVVPRCFPAVGEIHAGCDAPIVARSLRAVLRRRYASTAFHCSALV